MKRGTTILILIIIIVAGMILAGITEEDLGYKGELAESKSPQNLSIFVLPPIPIITIISPQNITYSSTSILLNYSAINAETGWYNLDYGENITLTSPITFTASEGSHILLLYANNSEGLAEKNISFSVHVPSTNGNGGNGGNGGRKTGNGGVYVPPVNQTPACQESWTCTAWTTCTDNTQQRTCTDTNNCNQTQRTETRACTSEPPETPEKVFPWYWILIIILIIVVMIAILKRKQIKKLTNKPIKKLKIKKLIKKLIKKR